MGSRLTCDKLESNSDEVSGNADGVDVGTLRLRCNLFDSEGSIMVSGRAIWRWNIVSLVEVQIDDWGGYVGRLVTMAFRRRIVKRRWWSEIVGDG